MRAAFCPPGGSLSSGPALLVALSLARGDIACRIAVGGFILDFTLIDQCEPAMAALPETLAADASLAAGTRGESRLWVIARNTIPFLVLAVLWEIAAYAGFFPPKLFPPIEAIVAALYRLTVSGILLFHVAETLLRLGAGFALAAIVGVTLGILMGRSRLVEDMALPLVSIGAPIPGIAYAPLFMLWFDLGNQSAILLVGFVSAFPIVFNTWTGVKAVKEVWVRSAQVMGADNQRLFRKVILPGALPYILTGLRLGL